MRLNTIGSPLFDKIMTSDKVSELFCMLGDQRFDQLMSCDSIGIPSNQQHFSTLILSLIGKYGHSGHIHMKM
jgi:hypothetical protein